MPQGTVKTIVADRGFGFISRGAGQSDLFFHVKDSQLGDLAFDEKLKELPVEFDEVEGREGKTRAVRVRPLRQPSGTEPSR